MFIHSKNKKLVYDILESYITKFLREDYDGFYEDLIEICNIGPKNWYRGKITKQYLLSVLKSWDIYPRGADLGKVYDQFNSKERSSLDYMLLRKDTLRHSQKMSNEEYFDTLRQKYALKTGEILPYNDYDLIYTKIFEGDWM